MDTEKDTQDENNEMTEAEVGVRCLEAKECQGLRDTPTTKRNALVQSLPWVFPERIAMLILCLQRLSFQLWHIKYCGASQKPLKYMSIRLMGRDKGVG